MPEVIQDGVMLKPTITVIEDGRTELTPEYMTFIEDFDWRDEFGFLKNFGESFEWKDEFGFLQKFEEDFSGWE